MIFRDQLIAMRVLCNVIFCTFTFLYLYFYQADIMVVAQHVASGGKTHYVPLAGALLITLALQLLQVGVRVVTGLYKRTYALTYLPSLLILIFITDISSDVTTKIDFGIWAWIFPFFLLIYIPIVYLARKYQVLEPEIRFMGASSQLIWINVGLLLLMLICVGVFSNSDEPFHYRARIECKLLKNDIDEALTIGKESKKTDSSLMMLRAYALSCHKLLGERLFEYPLLASSENLCPDGKRTNALVFPQNKIEKRAKKNYDYLLSGLLLDKKLDKFVVNFQKYYALDKPLPKHYKEAVILYEHISKHPKIAIKSHEMENEFSSFCALADDLHGNRLKLQEQYGKTYWYYYRFVEE
ncbi:MAG: hypothetical protein IJV27_01180 [Prevotella sp.]|nr:hypothetical protein [Prevotella sp.]